MGDLKFLNKITVLTVSAFLFFLYNILNRVTFI